VDSGTAEGREGEGEQRGGEGEGEGREDACAHPRVNADAGGLPDGHFHPKTSVMTSLHEI
jgi:hypothetical protein